MSNPKIFKEGTRRYAGSFILALLLPVLWLTDGRSFAADNPAEQPPIVIVVAGQSNASARSEWPAYSLTGMVTVNRDVFRNPGDDRTICKEAELPMLGEDVVPTKAHPVFHSLPFIDLGDRLAKARGRRVRIVNVAVGGTYASDWAGHLGDILAQAVVREKPNVVLFIQGESDRGNSAETYYQNIKTMLAKLKGWHGPIFLGFTTWLDPQKGVRNGQERLVKEGLVLPGVDLDALRLEQPAPTVWDRLHLDEPRMHRHGEEWFRILSRYL